MFTGIIALCSETNVLSILLNYFENFSSCTTFKMSLSKCNLQMMQKKSELLHYQSCSWFPYFIGMQSNKNILKIQQKDMLGHTETSKKQFFQCICTPRDTCWRKHAYYLSLYCKGKVPSSIQTSAWLSTSFFKKISHCGKLPPALA